MWVFSSPLRISNGNFRPVSVTLPDVTSLPCQFSVTIVKPCQLLGNVKLNPYWVLLYKIELELVFVESEDALGSDLVLGLVPVVDDGGVALLLGGLTELFTLEHPTNSAKDKVTTTHLIDIFLLDDNIIILPLF